MLAHFGSFDGRLSRRAVIFGTLAAASCARRKGTAFAGFAFVANGGARSVAAVDLASFTLVRQIGVETAPNAVIPHATKPVVYVLAPESGHVYEIDAAKLAIARHARLNGPALSMRLSADGKSLWVLQPRTLVRIDCDRMKAVQSVRLPGAAERFDINAAGRAAIGFSEGRLALMQLDAGVIDKSLNGGQPSLVQFQSDGKQLLVASSVDRTLSILETMSGRTVVRLPLPLAPANFCFTPDGGQMFITGPGMDAVVIVFPYNTEIGETILAGRGPAGMAVSPNPPFLFVANPQSGTITVLDIDTRKLVASMAVGQEPRHILITPDGQYALVLNERSGDMAVIRIAAFRARRHRNDPPPLFTMIPVGAQPVSAAVVGV